MKSSAPGSLQQAERWFLLCRLCLNHTDGSQNLREKWVKSDVFPALAAIFHTLRSCEVTPAAAQKHSEPEPWTGEQERPPVEKEHWEGESHQHSFPRRLRGENFELLRQLPPLLALQSVRTSHLKVIGFLTRPISPT